MGLLDRANKKKTEEIARPRDEVKPKEKPNKKIDSSDKKSKKTDEYIEIQAEPEKPEESIEAAFEDPEEEKTSKPTNSLGIDFDSIRAEVEGELHGKRPKKKVATKPFQNTGLKNRISTGIPGLDEVMEGGFRKETVVLIAGGPGSGKSIFSMQFLVNGVEAFNEPGVYVSFEQTEDELLDDMDVFGWNLRKKVKEKKLAILSYTPEQVEKVLSTGGGTIRDTIESIKAKRVVIDSLTAFTLLHESELAKRKACFTLFEAIRKWGCTALLIEERVHNPDSSHDDVSVEEFEVDGVLILYNIRRSDVRERALEIFKMRATKHSNKIFPMTVNEAGVNIYPEETIF